MCPNPEISASPEAGIEVAGSLSQSTSIGSSASVSSATEQMESPKSRPRDPLTLAQVLVCSISDLFEDHEVCWQCAELLHLDPW